MNFYLKNYLSKSTNLGTSVQLFVAGDAEKIKSFTVEKAGVYKYKSGKYSAIYIPAAAVELLSRQSFVQSIYFEGHQAQVMNDSMRIRNNVDSVQLGYAPLNYFYSGQGVISAVIDTGVDFLHPDLRDANGNTRIIAIWDQTAPYDAQLTPQYGYGVVWDSASINQGICTQFDPNGFGGHGTTVIGTASGNGFATGNYKGAAPNSSILFVKNPLGGANWTATIADAVDWIFHVGDSLNMPVSINISLGSYGGSHDGLDPAAQYIDSLIRAKRGRLVMASAGNSGNSALYGNYHLETTVDTDTSFTWFNYNPTSSLGYGSVYFEVYADTADFNNVLFAMGADATTPIYSFRGRTGFHNIQTNLNITVTDSIKNGTNVLGIVDYYAEEMNGVYILYVHMQQPDSSQYKFRFMTTGSGKFDVWSGSWMGISNMTNASGIPSVAQFPDIVNYVAPDSAKVIVSSFQCLSSVVTVANYNNNNTYIDFLGNTQSFPTQVGQISLNSSRGPTRDNRMKPDIAASGDPTMSCAPLSVLAYQQTNEPHKVAPDGMHTRNGGTSIASPVVSGIGALLLEKCPTLNWDEFQLLMKNNASSDIYTGSVPNITWGYGKINAFRTLVASNYSPLISGSNQFCFGDSVVLTANGYVQYTWNNGDTTSTITVDSTTTISLFVKDDRGCKSDTSFFTVTESPALFLSIDGFQSGIGAGISVWTNDVNSGITWYVQNDLGVVSSIGTIDSVNFNPNVFDPNYVNVWYVYQDSNSCIYFSDTLTLIYGSLDENDNSNQLSVFPNPVIDNEINLMVSDDVISRVELIDVNGKQILQLNSKQKTNNLKLQLNLSAGVYFIKVKGEKSIYLRKIIKS